MAAAIVPRLPRRMPPAQKPPDLFRRLFHGRETQAHGGFQRWSVAGQPGAALLQHADLRGFPVCVPGA